MKTTPNSNDPVAFLNEVENEKRRADAFVLLEMMQRITGEPPVMWGPSIVGFGEYEYQYANGKTGNWMLTAFSPRKSALTVYMLTGFEGSEGLLKRLGKHKVGKSCLYIRYLSDIDLEVLETMVSESVAALRKH